MSTAVSLVPSIVSSYPSKASSTIATPNDDDYSYEEKIFKDVVSHKIGIDRDGLDRVKPTLLISIRKKPCEQNIKKIK